jgi:two-component system, cell cycle sensor histidine kinase and response regulator CckA
MTYLPMRACTVMLVEDDEIVSQTAMEMCAVLGHKVITARDGVEALQLYRIHRELIDVVLLDLNMPRVDGEETFSEMKKMNEKVKVILVSGYPEQKIADKFSGKGLAGYIQKPYSLAAICNKLEMIIGVEK